MRLIDADELDYWYKGRPIRRVIDEAPTVDAVPVVRCKDCKNGTEAKYFPTGWWCWKHGFPAPKDGYCWEGVKRDG